jgi:murein DD-endopeptidase MepM/ murein hydrolase activator NlpD
MTLLKKIWEHRVFFSVALSDTSAVRGVRLRAFWPIFLIGLVIFTTAGLAIVGENTRARLAARVAGDVQTTAYLDRIAQLESEKEVQAKQVALIAQELGILQARLDRFDVIGEKLVADEDLSVLLGKEETSLLEGGQGGPSEVPLETIPSLEDLQLQLGELQSQADRTAIALELGMALAVRDQEGQNGAPYHFPVIHPRAYVSSSYGWRKNPFNGKRKQWHSGLDIAASRGSAIVSAADGIVVYAGYRYAYGFTVEIRHAAGFSTKYAHLKKVTVQNGQHVKAGDLVALMGSTGRSTGPHVHFEILKDDEKLNPYPFVKGHLSTARRLGREGHGERLVNRWLERERRTAQK